MSDDPKSVSRRSFLTASAAVVAGTAATATDAEAVGFLFGYRCVSKSEAIYQSRPNRGQRCGLCRHFRGPNRCAIVCGDISPQGWCRFFEAAGRRGGRGTGY